LLIGVDDRNLLQGLEGFARIGSDPKTQRIGQELPLKMIIAITPLEFLGKRGQDSAPSLGAANF
jgi:hypothetical protein